MSQPEPINDLSPVYLKAHLRTLLCLGTDILPIKSKIKHFFFRIYSSSIISMMILFTASQLIDMIVNFEDIYKMTFQLAYFITHVVGTVKIILILVLRKKMRHHLQNLESGIFKPNIERGGLHEMELIKNGITLYNRQGYFFYTFVIAIVCARTLYSMSANLPFDKHIFLDANNNTVMEPKVMPYPNWWPFDYNKRPYYEFVALFQSCFMAMYGCYIGATDSVFWGLLILIKIQFLFVRRQLETLLQRAFESAGFQLDENVLELDPKIHYFLSKLSNQCAIHHQKLIILCDQAEEDFCYVMLLQFLCSIFIVTMQLFQLSSIAPGSVDFYSMSMYLILMLYQIFCYCWHGNEVRLVSGQISSDVYYSSNWVLMNQSVKSSLILIMMRSQRPIYFTAGKFTLLSNETFMTIVRGAASYFMFLKQLSA